MKPSYEILEKELAATKAELKVTQEALLKTQELLKIALDEIDKLKKQRFFGRIGGTQNSRLESVD